VEALAMNDLVFKNKTVYTGGNVIETEYPILDAFALSEKTIVLIDPDIYLADLDYKKKRQGGTKAYKNLQAFSPNGTKLWDAQFPEDSDYYYKISSRNPLVAYSFSSYKCEIDLASGEIKKKEFLK
jgi:hypothetical protein